MKPNYFDVIVIGVGSMGSAGCYWLAKRGYKILGLEQFHSPHEQGSHTGQSRIIRKAYFEHPDYVPLLERAYENWRNFEEQTGEKLYHQTGLVYHGTPVSSLINGVKLSASLYSIPVEYPDHDQSQTRFPQFTLPDNFETIYEPNAGLIPPETAIHRYRKEAQELGALIHDKEKVIEWKKIDGVYQVITDKNTYQAAKLVITAGAWTAQLLPELATGLTVTRQTIAWVEPQQLTAFSLGNFPCWLLEDERRGMYYGFPLLPKENFAGPSGLKIAHHHPGQLTDADHVNRDIDADDEEDIRFVLNKYFPEANARIIEWKTCLYTNSKDENFIIDYLPGYDNDITIACGFSGHGFKFVSVIGEILADLAIDGKTNLPIGFLRLR